jgi:hypothetical protein
MMKDEKRPVSIILHPSDFILLFNGAPAPAAAGL